VIVSRQTRSAITKAVSTHPS